MSAPCEHLEGVSDEDVVATECPECVAMNATWVHLRSCVACGHIGCCDNSPNRHARAHATEHGHHLMRTAEPDENWVYCFDHDVAVRF